jgi:hypothetical protein
MGITPESDLFEHFGPTKNGEKSLGHTCLKPEGRLQVQPPPPLVNSFVINTPNKSPQIKAERRTIGW